jgi:imidazolonepropionase-like amidohydrolase
MITPRPALATACLVTAVITTVQAQPATRLSNSIGPSADEVRAVPNGDPDRLHSGDTLRFTIIVDGHSKGERRMWLEGPGTWRFEYEGDPYYSYHFPRSERLVLDAEGLPVQVQILGESGRGTWEEWFELQESRARWSTLTRWSLRPFDPPDLFGGDPFKEVGKQSADTLVVGPTYYAAVYPVHDVGVAARALLLRPDRSLPLLPAGEARLEILGERGVDVAGRSRRIHLHAVHGLDLRPVYVWLDEDGVTFADEWSIRAGWEALFPELRVATEQALADHHGRLVEGLVPPVRERPLVIRGARLFDPAAGTTRPDVTIVVEGDRIAAVSADGSMDLPPGAEIIDATGRTALPGLWDMHAHHGIPSRYLELDAPLHLAGGITTARDLGSHTGPILSLQSRIESGEALGPRLLLSGFIDGPGRRPSGVLVGSAPEARAAVDRFAELGYVQIKIFGQVPPDLVPAIIERARARDMRVSGHIPAGMNLRDAVEAGFDEIQHAYHILLNLDGVPDLFADLGAAYEAIARLTADPVQVRELVELLVTHEVALDPTLTLDDRWRPVPLPWFVRMLERLPPQARRRVAAAQGFEFWPVHPIWDQIFDNLLDIVRQMHEAGVPVLPGSDMMPGIAVHRELELYVQAGIPAPEVLTLATLGAARAMGMDDELGSIAPGKLADLILVDGDPTTDVSDIRRVVTVIKDGRVYDPAAIYRALGVEPCCER